MMNKTVPKTSVKGPLNLFRRLAVALVLLFAAQGVWGETYYWVGGATNGEGQPDNSWSNANNWNTAENGSGASEVPSSTDIVYIRKEATINIGSSSSRILDTSWPGDFLSQYPIMCFILFMGFLRQEY